MLNRLRFTNNLKVREKSNNFLLSKALSQYRRLNNNLDTTTKRYNNMKENTEGRIELEKKIKQLKMKRNVINNRIYTIKKNRRYNYQRKTVFPRNTIRNRPIYNYRPIRNRPISNRPIRNRPIYNYRPIRNRPIRNRPIYKLRDDQNILYNLRTAGIYMGNNIRENAYDRQFIFT